MRVTVSLPDDLLADLDFVAARFGISRSGVVTGLLQEIAPSTREIAALMPPEGAGVSEADVMRFRGASAEVISKKIATLLMGEVQNDLFPK
jgi:hypothetical protein